MTEQNETNAGAVLAGCVECNAGWIAARCDGAAHPDVEIQRCDACETLPDDNAAALLFVRMAETLAPDKLESLAAAVNVAVYNNADRDANASEPNADGNNAITIEPSAPFHNPNADRDTLALYDISCGQWEMSFLDSFAGWTVQHNGTDYRLIAHHGRGVVTLHRWDNDRDALADCEPIKVDLSRGAHALGIY